MAQGPQTKSTEGRSAGEVIALVLSIGWMILVGAFFYFLPPTSTVADRFDSLRFILILIAIFMPVAMVWVATAASQSARIMKEESGRLQAAIDGMRKTYIENRAGPVGGMQPTVEKKLKITSVQATTSDDQPTLVPSASVG